ncbi:dephospho-CoA kinase [Endomicrobiia bacterium]|nr:dephospho-CoA kinase [Endomicrobiia bacterium]GHT69778.1 dephospho-CoA kinase [Endomicrobiia bacterium]GHT74511.1 dephospho-CoA kinase [Endomicrobiia bacterium]
MEMIIGLTGSNCSGKDTIAEYISKKYDYKRFSLSDIIREIMKEKGIEPIRENLITFGTKLREENGNGVLAKKVLEKMDLDGKYCITSIRHPDEVNELRKRKNFVLVNIDASQKVRFERMRKRKRQGDPSTLERFIYLERQEYQIEGSGQQLRRTANMADVTFTNDSNDITTLEVTIEDLLDLLHN